MARIAGVTPRHLDRLFAAHLSATFLDQYRRIRLQHARRLLEQSPLSISEIAIATGFSSGAHFSRAYRNLYGIAPSETRAA
jgi:transcriptional regulator GlxA family with amidase domain